jgi:hypothetical protein
MYFRYAKRCSLRELNDIKRGVKELGEPFG